MPARPKHLFSSRMSFQAYLLQVEERALALTEELRGGEREMKCESMAEELRDVFELQPLLILLISEFRCSADKNRYLDRSTGQVTELYEISVSVPYRGSRFFFGMRPKAGFRSKFGAMIGTTSLRLYSTAPNHDLRVFAAEVSDYVSQMRDAYQEFRPQMIAMRAHVDQALMRAYTYRQPGEWPMLMPA